MSSYPHNDDESTLIVYHSWLGRLERAGYKHAAYDRKAVGWIYRDELEKVLDWTE